MVQTIHHLELWRACAMCGRNWGDYERDQRLRGTGVYFSLFSGRLWSWCYSNCTFPIAWTTLSWIYNSRNAKKALIVYRPIYTVRLVVWDYYSDKWELVAMHNRAHFVRWPCLKCDICNACLFVHVRQGENCIRLIAKCKWAFYQCNKTCIRLFQTASINLTTDKN